jgi:hypothetical protein
VPEICHRVGIAVIRTTDRHRVVTGADACPDRRVEIVGGASMSGQLGRVPSTSRLLNAGRASAPPWAYAAWMRALSPGNRSSYTASAKKGMPEGVALDTNLNQHVRLDCRPRSALRSTP